MNRGRVVVCLHCDQATHRYREIVKEIVQTNREWPGPQTDTAIVLQLLAQGFDKRQIVRALREASPELNDDMSLGETRLYAKKIFQLPDVMRLVRKMKGGGGCGLRRTGSAKGQ